MKIIEKIYAANPKWTILAPNTRLADESITYKDLISWLINWLGIIAGFIAIVYLIYSGILYLTAGGNPDQAKKGQQGVINAVIGIVIIVGIWIIIRVATNFASGII